MGTGKKSANRTEYAGFPMEVTLEADEAGKTAERQS